MRVEDWSEPWVWRPEDWPGQPLTLQIVGNRHVPRAVSPGNRFTPLYSFNGSSPGPTIRTRGDAVLRVKLRNMLGPNHGQVPKGPRRTRSRFRRTISRPPSVPSRRPRGRLLDAADTGARAPRRAAAPHSRHARGHELPRQPRERAARIAHHQPAHARRARRAGHESERHAGGQHVPARAAQGDWEIRQRAADGCIRTLEPHERVAEADFEFALGNVMRHTAADAARPIPILRHALVSPALPWRDSRSGRQRPGRLLHHRRRRGRCDQSGDDRKGPARPDREDRAVRLPRTRDDDSAGRGVLARYGRRAPPQPGRLPAPVAINGGFSPTVIFMRPGAVERWRVLNASVDGRGTKSFMVLEGQFVFADRQLWKVKPGEPPARRGAGDAAGRRGGDTDHLPAVVRRDHARHRRERPRPAHHQGSLEAERREREPARSAAGGGRGPTKAMLRNVEDCYRDGESVRNLFVRPNQIFLTNANRADVFFKAPRRRRQGLHHPRAGVSPAHRQLPSAPAGGHRLRPQRLHRRQPRADRRGRGLRPRRRRAGGGGDFDVMSLRDRLPEVPPYLQPVADDELRVPAPEAHAARCRPEAFAHAS